MQFRAKLAAAGLLAGLPFLGVGATPADATQVRRNLTFTFEGQEVTCTVAGSGNSYFQEDSGYSVINGATDLDDDDEACHEAIVEIYVDATYRRDPGDDPDHVSSGLADAERVSIDVLVRGTLSSVVVSHTAVFLCDNEPFSSTCPLTFTTYTK